LKVTAHEEGAVGAVVATCPGVAQVGRTMLLPPLLVLTSRLLPARCLLGSPSHCLFGCLQQLVMLVKLRARPLLL
jgi:hypothetical protein